jgi:Xaa-Pro aminopeptidase
MAEGPSAPVGALPAPAPPAAGADRRPDRVAALVERLEAEHLDAVLLTGLANVRYVTGFTGSSALAAVTRRGEVLLVTDFRYQTQVADEVGDFARVVIEQASLWAGLWQHLAAFGYVEVAGFESAHLLHRDFQRLLEAGARWGWRPTADLVEGLRERKDAGEVARIRAAGRRGRRGARAHARRGAPGLTELPWPASSSGTCARAAARGSRSRRSSRAARGRRSRTRGPPRARSRRATSCSSTSARSWAATAPT